jgi:Fe2+ transport system protein FeoA
MDLGFTKGVQITLIRKAGPFDQGPFIPLPGGQY